MSHLGSLSRVYCSQPVLFISFWPGSKHPLDLSSTTIISWVPQSCSSPTLWNLLQCAHTLMFKRRHKSIPVRIPSDDSMYKVLFSRAWLCKSLHVSISQPCFALSSMGVSCRLRSPPPPMAPLEKCLWAEHWCFGPHPFLSFFQDHSLRLPAVQYLLAIALCIFQLFVERQGRCQLLLSRREAGALIRTMKTQLRT